MGTKWNRAPYAEKLPNGGALTCSVVTLTAQSSSREKKGDFFGSGRRRTRKMGDLNERLDKKKKKKKTTIKNKKTKKTDAELFQNDIMLKKEEEGSTKNEPIKKKRKREKGSNANARKTIQLSEDQLIKVEGEKKRNKAKKERKSEDKSNALVGKFDQLGSDAKDGFSRKLKKEEEGDRKNEPMRKTRREKGNNTNARKAIQTSEDQLIEAEGEKKRNKPKKEKKSDKNNALVGTFDQLGSDAKDGFSRKLKEEEEGDRKNEPIRKKKRRRETGNNADARKAIQKSEDQLSEVGEKKRNKPKKERKHEDKNNAVVGKFDQLGSDVKDGFNEQNDDGTEEPSLVKPQGMIDNSEGQSEAVFGTEIRTRKSKKSKKKKKDHGAPKEGENILEKGVAPRERQNIPEKREEAGQEYVYYISSGDDDCSKGMKKWVMEYRQSRPGLKVLQQRIDEFIAAHEEKLEQERKEREALAAEGGWTVVKHHKGRKKTTDSVSGITVGSVAPAVVEDNFAKKKNKEVGVNFYRFQKRENQRNEILMLQSKFEQDKKRIQQLRAARKFRPY